MVYRAIRRLYARLSDLLSKGTGSAKLSLASALLCALGWLVLSLSLRRVAGAAGLVLAGALMLFVQVFLALVVIRKLNELTRRRMHDERAMQAMVGLYLTLKPERPLPYLRGVALSTDSCLDYVRLIRQLQPKTIVELGSGSSTVVAGYQLKQNGKGRVIALDHDERWGEVTRGALLEHGLTDVAEVRIASLKPVDLAGHEYYWYDLLALEDVGSIDILLIDGPPDPGDFGTRYPALDLLSERIGDQGVILVDDCVMPRWSRMVHKWAVERGFTVETHVLNEKNTLFLRRQRNGEDNHGGRQAGKII